jgi:hypothetical protein
VNGPNAEKVRRDREIAEFGAWILEANKNQERFPFPGIDPDAYAKIIEMDSLIPRHLPLDGIMDGRLRQLVKISKTRRW